MIFGAVPTKKEDKQIELVSVSITETLKIGDLVFILVLINQSYQVSAPSETCHGKSVQ